MSMLVVRSARQAAMVALCYWAPLPPKKPEHAPLQLGVDVHDGDEVGAAGGNGGIMLLGAPPPKKTRARASAGRRRCPCWW